MRERRGRERTRGGASAREREPNGAKGRIERARKIVHRHERTRESAKWREEECRLRWSRLEEPHRVGVARRLCTAMHRDRVARRITTHVLTKHELQHFEALVDLPRAHARAHRGVVRSCVGRVGAVRA
eukprot:5546194-Pleurochrysis_carterae.AAC.1